MIQCTPPVTRMFRTFSAHAHIASDQLCVCETHVYGVYFHVIHALTASTCANQTRRE
jgi:hypothetical protein